MFSRGGRASASAHPNQSKVGRSQKKVNALSQTSPPQVAELINKLLNTPQDDLISTLGEIDSWKWQRSDLNAWIKVLNKFDAVLEEVIRDYDIDKLQIKDFTPKTKTLLSEILRFERLLLENSTNRKMYNSYDRLNSLLFTSDLDVLVLALKLLLRPSQQYSSQPAVSQALNISTPRLLSLAKRWPHLREYGIELVELANPKGSTEIDTLPTEARDVNFTFYRTDGASKSKDEVEQSTIENTPRKSAPTPATSSTSGAVNVHIDEQTLQAKPAMIVLSDAIAAHNIPDTEKFDLLCRVRASAALMKGREEDREKLVVVRLLSIAIYAHTHPESQAATSLFLFEPDLITHISELLKVERDISVPVQTAAIAALDALARYRSKIQEVLTSVNAGVNHGILMGLVRKTVNDIADVQSTIPHSLVEALLSFVTFIASHASGGNMVVGAGIIPLLIQIIENRLPNRLAVVSKTMQLVDNVLYSFTNAFNLFCSSHGIEALVGRIEFEVDLDIQEHGDSQRSREIFGSHGELPVARAAALKHILRSLHRMMQSSGTSEGLRGLIDMSILKSIKKIIEYRGLFGPSVLPIAINIMSTFVHNEPTSLTVIQEAGLPETFYKSLELGLEPAIEVIQAIPNAIGALCLNEVGQAQLSARPSIIPAIFSIFTSDRHLKILLEKENAVLIGTAMDELIRHHPMLKTPVFDALKTTMDKIEELGNAYEPPEEIRHWYQLVPHTESVDDSKPMEGVETIGSSDNVATPDGEPSSSSSGKDEPTTKPHDNNIVSFIDIVGRFLEGLFQHTPHCRDFISAADGLTRLGRLTALPCLPYDFANSVASDSMVQSMRTMTEVATSDTLVHLARLVRDSLAETEHFWSVAEKGSKLLPLVNVNADNLVNSTHYFRSLVTLHIRITLLSDVFATAGYAHGRAAIALLQTLMSNTSPQVVSDLGSLHRVSIWENIILKKGLSDEGIELPRTPGSPSVEGSPDHANIDLPEQNGASNALNGNTNELSTTPAVTPPKETPVKMGPREHNALALKHLTHGLPTMVKMFHSRRTPDPAQKKQMLESSAVVADIMMKHLSVKDLGDTSSLYTYYGVMLGLVTILLIDERTTTHTLHTVELVAFYRAGGLHAVLDVCRSFMASIETISEIKEAERTDAQSQELSHAYSGLKIALHLLHPLISSKPLFDSGQTVIVLSKDKAETDPEYFEPHNFLVRLRLTILPLLRSLWESRWLIKAPLGVSRSIVQAVLEIINGDDEVKNETESGPSSALPPRPTVSDESRLRQLTDMGFPRSAAERALQRTNNNVTAATEILIAQPFFPADPEPDTPAAVVEGSDPLTADSSAETPANQDEEASSSEPPEPVPETTDTPKDVGKTSEQWRKELEEAREPLRAGISRQALLLVDEHLSLLFDLHAAFIRPPNSHQQKAVQDLVDDIKAFSPFAYDVQEQPLANRCRLLALVLCETPSSLSPELRASLMEHLLALLLSNPVSIDPKQPTIPKWLAAHLLVTEALFTLSEEPRKIDLPGEGEDLVSQPLTVGPPLNEARTMVFDFCLRLLAIPDLPTDELLSALRLFVLLTRNHEFATQFVKRDGLALLFKRLQASPVGGSSSYVAILLRHIIEDRSTIQKVMAPAIKRYFSSPRTRIVDVATFLRNCSTMALHDPVAFIETTQSLCQLSSPYASSHQISLKSEASAEDKTGDQANVLSEPTDMQVDMPAAALAPVVPPSTESVEAVMYFLISELTSASKEQSTTQPLEETSNNDSSSNARNDPMVTENAQPEKTDEATSKAKAQHQYLCFLMQCMTELLFSYDACKIAFLTYSPKKRSATPAKESANRFRAATMNFLLSDLVSFGTINPQSHPDARGRMTVCNWAMSVIVALCVDSSSVQEAKEVSAELVSVRKYVLESISRAIKDLPPESVDARYGRLLALGDLCHRLLTVRFNSSSRKQSDETPTQIAKVMLEKNFVATLTNSLSDVDLNYPNVKNLIAAILRPLEYLTKVAIKMSRSPGKGKDSLGDPKPESVASYSSGSEDEEEREREETPDLYRNSALGMYGGEMDDMNYNEDEDMDEDDEAEEGDEDMDFGEETGSEDTSGTEDDEDDPEDMEEDGEPDEAWDEEGDEEEGEEDGLVEEDPDEDNDEEEEHEDQPENEEIEDGQDMMWQDLQDDLDPEDIAEEVDDEEESGGPIQIIHEEDEEEPEMISDDDYGQELNITESGDLVRDIFGFSDPTSIGGAGFFVPRRHRSSAEDNIPIFGRARNGPAPPPEATIHPLLLDASSNRTQAPHLRNSRPPQRIVTGGTTDLLQTIEELVGGGAIQLFHHIMARGRGGGGPETIRLDVPAGAFMELGRSLGRRPPHIISASVRMDRNPRPTPSSTHPRSLEPLLTLQRWAEEVKILHGDFVSERAAKIVNHVILALLPAAIEAEKQAKIKAEEEAKKHREEEEAEKLRESEARAEEERKAQEEPKTQTTEADKADLDKAEADKAEADKAEAATTEQETSAAAEETGPPKDDVQEAVASTEDQTMEDAPAIAVDDDTEMADATAASGSTSAPSSSNPAEESPLQAGSSEAADAPTPARVTVTIHGNEVDITDTGIDPTFLEALPDDMREEVLNQHIRDQRASRVERPSDSQISVEFLDALPPEIRAEIIQQEAMERARRSTEEAQVAASAARIPTDIDPASFIASLDPTLRQAILMEQDDGFIQTLPAHMIAEAGTYREAAPRRHIHIARGPRSIPTSHPVVARKFSPQHDAIQLLDKAGVAILVRLLFFPQVLKKSLLFRVLVNLCENSKTRTELFNLLLNILQDGTGDLAAVDKSFSQMSFRNSKPQKPVGKQKASSDLVASLALPQGQETVPDLIAQRCLEALSYIVSSNPSSSLFFLTEHELPAGLRRAFSKKGKGKERQMPQTHYPIVLILSLLDRQSLLRTPSIMESVVSLLATVTRPIKEAKLQAEASKPSAAAESSNAPTAVPSSDAAPSANSGDTETVPPASDSPIPDASQPAPSATSPSVPQLPTAAPNPPPTSASKDRDLTLQAVEQQILLANPPQIPHAVLRLIVNILTVGECSSRTFQQSLNLIQHLSYIPDARDVIAQELKAKAQEFGQTLQNDLNELATALHGTESQLNSVASKFSAPSSVQAKLLRVLKTIDYMYSPKPSPPGVTTNEEEDSDKVQAIYESFQFAPLWRRLGDCLAIIDEKSETEHVATVLLPLIESLMVVCKYVGSKTSSLSRLLRMTASPKSPTTPRESMEDLFVTFTDAHRKILNVMVRNNPSLMSGSFSLLVHNPRVLDFDNKRNFFTQQLHRRPHAREHHGTIQLNVRRARVFEDSFQQFQRKTGDQIKYGKLSIRFYEEEGVDAGGLTREWFQILARQMFDPNNALFQPCAADKLTYQPNRRSYVNPEHLSFFKFVGRVIGKAIYDGRLLDAYFARSLYRQLLGKPVDYRDVEWVDPEYYNSLCWILENDPTPLELTFSVEDDEFGVNRIFPLKEGGETLPVTQENKREFVQLSAQYRLYSSIKDQIESLLSGFYEVIPKDLITIFNEQELELLISGTPDIDVDEWRAATEYNGYTSSDPNIVWWWRALKSFNRDERAKVLSFATGTSRVPLGGFVELQGVQGNQKFSIHKAYGDSDRLPQAHTCFNQIDLPQYSSYEMLRQQLLLAISEGGEGFGFV
ncbi:E3 ubiquitin-protein ligase tom1 [Marasmius crinis-equi]|uniref:HECT-type E3 ubiquitin transferase n=1 Tax=Marasmius crinis-equi TaxID=585013 RepID=A0ABR3F3Q3_9AGAR